ncbi:MAG: hypothetical protein M1834_004365 [Cirrosporium novae-zelandiae]|nr:MAG: hypothetical protein M1834_004365 [Cirrosporium novae-zelandiae]
MSSTPRLSFESSTSLPPNPSSPDLQHPLPPHDTFQRYGSRYRPRRGSTASSITSVGGVLDTASQSRGESIAEAGQNAISSLLQPPIVRTGLLPHTSLPASSAYKAPSTKDIPPVALVNIPHVELTSFQPYLKQVGSLYEAFRRAKDGAEDGSQLFRRKDHSKTDELEGIIAKSLDHRRLSTASISSIRPGLTSVGSASETSTLNRRSSGQRRIHQVTPLSTIPNVYFEEDFHLENPRTFDIVSERSEVIRKSTKHDGKHINGAAVPSVPSGRKALATNAILQEKLSWYMDTVEIHLISSISTASASFFTALGSLRELHSEAATSVTRIQTLRKDLAKLDRDMASGGLKVVNMRRRRDNVRRLNAAVQQLQQVVAAVSQCEDQVDAGEVETAMDSLYEVENLMAGDQVGRLPTLENCKPLDRGRLIDLRNIKALEGAADDLHILRRRIGKAFETRFLESLLRDVRGHVGNVAPQVTLKRWGSASQRFRGAHNRTNSTPAYLNFNDELRTTLRSELNSLSRSGHLASALSAFQDSIAREMKSLIRRHLPSSNDDDGESVMSASTHGGRHMSQQEKSSILARNLRSLDPEDAEEMLFKIYTSVSEALRRLSVQVKVLLDLTSAIVNPPSKSPTKSPTKDGSTAKGQSDPSGAINQPNAQIQEDIQQALDMSNLLGQAVDVAQTQISKVLKVRSEQVSRLPPIDFLKYFTINRLFADECEAVSGRAALGLTTVVNSQIKDYVNSFGDFQRRCLIESMDIDRWDAKDFGVTENEILSRILESSTRDPEIWTLHTKIWETAPANSSQTNGMATNNASTTGAKVRSAVVDEQRYLLTNSAIVNLRSVEEFLQLMTGIPSMVSEITYSLIEYLKLFNSRSSQLILGAGATRSAGLKNITTKHLALASQALSFIVALIPYIREFVRRRATIAGGLVAEFDKLKRLFQDHQTAIHEKLVDIMSNRSATHIREMQKISWDTLPANGPANTYMEILTKETATLQKVLNKHLPEMTVQMIMGPVLDTYRTQWSKAFEDVVVRSESGRKRLLIDAESLKSKLGKIDSASDLGDRLLEIIKAKKLPEAEPPQQVKRDNRNGDFEKTTLFDAEERNGIQTAVNDGEGGKGNGANGDATGKARQEIQPAGGAS